MWARGARIAIRDLRGYNENAIVTAEVSISDEVWGYGVKGGVTRGRSGTPVEEWAWWTTIGSADSGSIDDRHGTGVFEASQIVVEIARLKRRRPTTM